MIFVIKSIIAFCKLISNEMYPCVKMNAKPNNNQLIRSVQHPKAGQNIQQIGPSDEGRTKKTSFYHPPFYLQIINF